ncbi:MAG: sigma-70 family RNA polymerase sigma factor [Isosphaeraceae bacterium]|nr:sigma-70 family RNA polymerase sigma factor [Isosphaeraceae bacterium]
MQCLTDHQSRLFAYLVALLGDVHEARNVLQETNLELWRKSSDFVVGTDFAAWSRTTAHFKVLAFLRDKKRDRHLFDEALLNQIAHRSQPDEDDDALRIALRHCLAALPDHLRWLIGRRYGSGLSIREIAQRVGKSEGALKVTLSRARKQLVHCIERRLAADP